MRCELDKIVFLFSSFRVILGLSAFFRKRQGNQFDESKWETADANQVRCVQQKKCFPFAFEMKRRFLMVGASSMRPLSLAYF